MLNNYSYIHTDGYSASHISQQKNSSVFANKFSKNFRKLSSEDIGL